MKSMIFAITGSQKFQFDRLLKKLDELKERKIITEKIFAQAGVSGYKPQNYQYTDFMSKNSFSKMEEAADLVITHGGTGAIIGAVKKGKRVIAVPRLKEYGEHVDDHQIQLVKEFDRMGIIKGCFDINELGKIYSTIYEMSMVPYLSNTDTIIRNIEHYLEEI